MITVQININGNCLVARSATRTQEPDALGKATYTVDDGNQIRHIPSDGAIALAHKLLDCIRESPPSPSGCPQNGMNGHAEPNSQGESQRSSVCSDTDGPRRIKRTQTGSGSSAFYLCGHSPEVTIMDSNIVSLSAWIEWKGSVGFDGDKSQCFDCWCDKNSTESDLSHEEECRYCKEDKNSTEHGK